MVIVLSRVIVRVLFGSIFIVRLSSANALVGIVERVRNGSSSGRVIRREHLGNGHGTGLVRGLFVVGRSHVFRARSILQAPCGLFAGGRVFFGLGCGLCRGMIALLASAFLCTDASLMRNMFWLALLSRHARALLTSLHAFWRYGLLQRRFLGGRVGSFSRRAKLWGRKVLVAVLAHVAHGRLLVGRARLQDHGRGVEAPAHGARRAALLVQHVEVLVVVVVGQLVDVVLNARAHALDAEE
nr:MAG: hypothetical protein [Molluscum contagiosum virus]